MERIVAWMTATFGATNPAADEGFIRLVLATIPTPHNSSTGEPDTEPVTGAVSPVGGEEPRRQPGSSPISRTTSQAWAGTQSTEGHRF